MAPRSEVTATSFGNVPKAVQEGNERAILELLINVTAEAKRGAQVAEGQLRNSIMYRSSEKEGGFNVGGRKQAESPITPRPKEGQGFVGTNLLHAIYNEFGTRYMAAVPFLRPAIAIQASGTDARKAVRKYEQEAVAAGMKKGPRVKKVSK
jgi:HK97 gp10 family phage protein